MSVGSSSNSSFHTEFCFSAGTTLLIYTAYFISYVLLLPLFTFVLTLGYQRWRKQRFVATAATMSHSDIITFNMVALELIGVLGLCFHVYGIYAERLILSTVGVYMLSIISPGQILFHLLTCLERYLAVVHPVTYLGLRRGGGVRIRNVSVGCVWLVCLASLSLGKLKSNFLAIYSLALYGSSSVVVSFCSLSVLCVLIRPGPGEEGGNRERVDQSKQRAFRLMATITGVVLIKLLSTIFVSVLYFLKLLIICDIYLIMSSLHMLSLPSSLVLPLLFLYRAGKLPGCKHNTVSA